MKHEKIIEKINEASLRFLEPLSPAEMYKTIVDEAKKLLNAEFGSIILERDGELERVYSSDAFFEKVAIRKKGYTYKAFKSQMPLYISVDSVEYIHPEFKKKKIQSILLLSLSYRNKSIGVISVQSLQRFTITKKDLEVFKLFGTFASMAIKKTQLYDETKKALETRDLFISLASHELRTPLTTLNGYIQLLHMKLGKNETSEGKWVRELYVESGRLTSLVKELLEINRIKQGQLQFNLQEVSLVEVIENAIKRIAVSYPQRVVTFINKVDTKRDIIIGDKEKLLQMVTAFITNALKFSPEQSEVTIILNVKGKSILVQINDKGTGIDQRDLPFIFDEFYKGSNSNEKGGMGVGLLFAKHIITYHKGTIKVDSTIKKGTTIEVSFPRMTINGTRSTS